MVSWAFLLATIIGGCFGAATNDTYDIKKIAEIGKEIYIENQVDTDKDCEIETNLKEKLSFKNDADRNLTERFGIKVRKGDCGATITVSANDTGIWTFKNEKSGDKRCFLFVAQRIEKVDLKSDRKFDVYKNDYMVASLPTPLDNLTGCYLVQENQTNGYKIIDLSKLGTEFAQTNRCGARFQATPKNAGTWNLIAMSGHELIIYTSFDLSLKDFTSEDIQNVTITRGKDVILRGHQSGVRFCKVKDPNGKIVRSNFPVQGEPYKPIDRTFCSYEIPFVTSQHAGMWTFYSYINYKMEAIEDRINVNVVSIPNLRVNVTYNENNITIICNTTYHHEIESCQFRNPSMEKINVFLGKGDDRYEYYGGRFGSDEEFHHDPHSIIPQECGIMIKNPEDTDFGMWRCLITERLSYDQTRTMSSLVYVGHNLSNFEISTEHPNKVFVREGHPFKVKCAVNRRLSYCWLRSPNGTVYNVATTTNSQPNTLLYDGLGLNMGECGAVLPAANHSDQGVWRCHMGIAEGAEVRTNVSVVVAETMLVPVQQKMKIHPTDRVVEIACMTFGNVTFKDANCRWISQQGSHILEDYDSRFEVSTNETVCSLKMHDVNVYETAGLWTCIMNKQGEQSRATVELYLEPKGTVWILVISLIFAVIVTGFASYFVYRFVMNRLADDRQLLVAGIEPIDVRTINVVKTRV